MSVDFVKPTSEPAYRVRAKAVSAEYLRAPGSLRVQHLMYLLDCSRSTVFKKLKRGHIPAPTGHDPRPFWSNEVIRQHLGISESPSAHALQGHAINCAGGVK